MKKLCLALLLILMLFAGNLGCGMATDKTDAEHVVTNLFEAIRNKDFDTSLTFYSPEFFDNTQVDWLTALKNLNTKLGDLQIYELKAWNIRKVAGTSISGTYFDAQYEVTYTKYTATEKFTLFRPASGDEFKITKHEINSVGLILE